MGRYGRLTALTRGDLVLDYCQGADCLTVAQDEMEKGLQVKHGQLNFALYML